MNNLQRNTTVKSKKYSSILNWDLNTSHPNPKLNRSSKLILNIKFKSPLNRVQTIIAYALILILFIYIILNASDNLNYNLILSEKNKLVYALLSTLTISIATLIISIIGGFVFYLFIKSRNTFLRTFTIAIREIVMGTPLLVMIFLVFYVFGISFGITNKLILGIIALSAYMIPYIANTYDSANAVIEKDQYTVMDLYHFSTYQKYRYILLPQMIKPLIPGMLNNLSSIIKGSALLKIVSISEISYVITVISNKNYASIEGYLIMWILYLIITIPLSLAATKLGNRYSK